MQIIRQSSFKALPWKNGGGITHEAIRVPAGGDPFRWRVSMARIDVSGPFSDFTGYGRWMVLLRGAGAALKFSNGHERTLRGVGEMAEFDGGLGVECELLNGPCMDLNLIASKTLRAVHARVERLEQSLPLAAAENQSMLVLPIDAPVELEVGADTVVLEPLDLAVITGSRDRAGNLTRRNPNAAATAFLATLTEG
jgi:uncharacterized protein